MSKTKEVINQTIKDVLKVIQDEAKAGVIIPEKVQSAAALINASQSFID